MFKTIPIPNNTARRPLPNSASLALLALLAGVACGSDDDSTSPLPGETAQPAGPFKSLEAVANAPERFTQPRAGVPLDNGDVALLATLEGQTADELSATGERVGLLLAPAEGGEPSVLYAGDAMVDPFDLAVSHDGQTLYVADPAVGTETQGAVLVLGTNGGEPMRLAEGYAPRSVTVAPDDSVYFSGVDPETGEPGVFQLNGSGASAVFRGAPLVDPSGIVLLEDGRVLVADTRLFDGLPEDGASTFGNEAGIVLIEDGQARVLVSGFATGYPAGIAVTTDERALVISGEGADRSDTVFIVDLERPEAEPGVVTDVFSAFKDASAGLKRAHDSNTFIWASLAAHAGGTVYRIVAN
jgi:DNA-binding beta-propeller fold protein YncE